MKRKHIAVILMAAVMATAVMPCRTYAGNPDCNAALTSEPDQKNILPTEKAFNDIAALPGFTALTQEDLQNLYPERFGSARNTCYKNSEPRDKVLEILDRIPRNMLCAEELTDNGKIARIYIAKDCKGKAEMLYVFVGKGSNDLMVTLFTGAEAEVYEHEADKMNRSMEEHGE